MSIAVAGSPLVPNEQYITHEAPSGYARGGGFYADYTRIIACARNGTREATIAKHGGGCNWNKREPFASRLCGY